MKQIFIKPIITEKSMNQVHDGKYSFCVNRSANKIEIAKEIAKIYKVKAIKVNIVNIAGRSKIFGQKHRGSTKSIQKAIITLKKGEKIKEFDVKE